MSPPVSLRPSSPAAPLPPPGAPPTPATTPTPPADQYQRGGPTTQVTTAQQADTALRQQYLDRMMRNLPADSGLRARIGDASSAFSTAQLQRMNDAGVVFAENGNIPSTRVLPGSHSEGSLRTPGRYLPESRVIQVRDNANSAQIRHEMAHAWDDVRNDRLRVDDGASQVARERLMARLNMQDARGQVPELRRRADAMPAGPQQRELRETIRDIETRGRREPAGFSSDTALRGAYDAYRQRMGGRPRDQGIDYAAREGHAMHNPREFYAEGFNAFHGSAYSRERVRTMAPELYSVLYREAQAAGTLPSGATAP